MKNPIKMLFGLSDTGNMIEDFSVVNTSDYEEFKQIMQTWACKTFDNSPNHETAWKRLCKHR